MIYDRYKIFNLLEFEALELVSKTYNLVLEDVGEVGVLVTKGNLVSITYEGVFLSLNLNEKNPFEFEGFAIFIDENDDVYLGINGREE
jgi:hypothetical protein